MMAIVVFIAALIVGLGLLITSVFTKKWLPTAVFWAALAFVLTTRYFVFGIHDSVAFAVGLEDIAVNFGFDGVNLHKTLATCVNNACAPAGSQNQYHASWTVAQYYRYAALPQPRTTLLLLHILGNTIGMALVVWQIYKPGDKNRNHRRTGYVAVVAVALSLAYAGVLGSEMGDLVAYGGYWTVTGLYFLALCSIFRKRCSQATAVQGMSSVRRLAG